MAEQSELTVLIYFASDNPLAPLVVSEIKAIKDAGFQQDTNVVVYFDPLEKNVPTQLYDINRRRKEQFRERSNQDPSQPKDQIGDGPDPFVRNVEEDMIDSSQLTPNMAAALTGPASAEKSLSSFVEFGIEKFKAKRYFLILAGHGMIVGNDAFLPDDDPISAITLKQLGDIVGRFVEDGRTTLDLLCLHSCSMSSIEVAYQLRGKARYLMATQGKAFVNSWPFRQLLKKTLNQVRRAAIVDIPELVNNLYGLCLHNATDFLFAGYSADLALCHLDTEIVEGLKDPIQKLVARLKRNLSPRISLVKDLILLAHWESQSYFNENYTDLFDFCKCLARRCADQVLVFTNLKDDRAVAELQDLISDCERVQQALVSDDPAKRLVLRAEHIGPQYQYSRGLSIYFPWSRPSADQSPVTGQSRNIIQNYQGYDFTVEFEHDSWFSFLDSYFTETMRPSRREEDGDKTLFEDFRELGVTSDGVETMLLAGERAFRFGAELEKRTPEEGTRTPDVGAACDCGSIKNYPLMFSISAGALQAFRGVVDIQPKEDGND